MNEGRGRDDALNGVKLIMVSVAFLVSLGGRGGGATGRCVVSTPSWLVVNIEEFGELFSKYKLTDDTFENAYTT